VSNRLLAESSPYLRQHAHNPVDWYPWGEEAFSRSRELNKPICLSIGYSACHWCHVMERESFEDAQTAAIMNEHFVNIKVDREERPDVDHVYQLVVQLMGRSGGWPLTVFLTPDLKPFFGGTYFPPVERYGMPSFQTLLHGIHDAYVNRRSDVDDSARDITAAIAKITGPSTESADAPADFLATVAQKLDRRIDTLHGGFGQSPKFPNTMNHDVLLRAARETGNETLGESVFHSLRAMRAGGIYDQIGGGFHRYSTDTEWLVPHFEKMLYDNALLARLYVDAWRINKAEVYRATARDTLRYVMREMRSPEGAFYSTQDADSEGHEGRFFVWTQAELRETLGESDGRIAAMFFGVTERANFEHGASILTRHRSFDDVAKEIGASAEHVEQVIDRATKALFDAREKRIKPFLDEKVIASWNGLMIGAFAEAGGAFDEVEFLDVAKQALAFARSKLWHAGGLRRIYKDGVAKIDAFLDDYADLANAALDVYENTADASSLGFASELVAAALARFWDESENTLFYSHKDAADLLVRVTDPYDSAVPSGISSMCHALLRLSVFNGDTSLVAKAESTLQKLTTQALDNPFGFGNLLSALSRYREGATEVVIVGNPRDADVRTLCAEVRASYVPNRALVIVPPDQALLQGLWAS
jgi:uncharacterized protein YyaL (SSP411 family)